MSYIPTVEQAEQLLRRYNKEEFHIKHGQIVSAVMGYFAKEHDPEQVEYWKTVGMLHDIDFELYPEQHCVKSREILSELEVEPSVSYSVSSHGHGLCVFDNPPQHIMEKYLFAVDELTGLIGAATRMRPSKSVVDLEISSLMKKFKDKKFAAGCSREVIAQGADMLGTTVEELAQQTIKAMQSVMDKLGL